MVSSLFFSSGANHEVRMPGLPCVYSVAGARFLMIQAALLGGILMENVVRFSSRANGVWRAGQREIRWLSSSWTGGGPRVQSVPAQKEDGASQKDMVWAESWRDGPPRRGGETFWAEAAVSGKAQVDSGVQWWGLKRRTSESKDTGNYTHCIWNLCSRLWRHRGRTCLCQNKGTSR